MNKIKGVGVDLKNMKKHLIHGILFGVLAVNVFYGAVLYSSAQEESKDERDSAYKSMEVFTQVMERVRSDYVDEDKVSYDDLIQGALEGMLNSLDPHSDFMTEDAFKALKTDTQGSFGGVGIQVSIRDNTLTAIAPTEDGPAYREGVMPGDKIIKIGDQMTQKMTLDEAVKELRGEPGTEVTITISRPSNGLVKEITIKREIIKVDTVKDINGKRDFNVDTNKIGYVRLTGFGEQTANDLSAAIDKFKEQKMEGLIIDLRNNGGGIVDEALEIADYFVEKDTVLLYEVDKDNNEKVEKAKDGVLINMPTIVLTNENTASSSEILAGALKDLGKAKIVGTKTYGKGVIQSLLTLSDGSGIKITSEEYLTPNKTKINKVGIEPDETVELPDTVTNVLRVEEKDDTQLQKAIQMLK